MKHWILAVAVLLGGAVGLASADYIIIKANVGQSRQPPATGPNGPFPGPGGTGNGPMPMGNFGGPMPNGNFGGPRPGGPMPNGNFGGPMPNGNFGGPMPNGNFGGPMPNQAGGTAGEGQPIEVLAVVEVDAPFRTLDAYKAKFDPRRPAPSPIETKYHLGRTEGGVVRLLNLEGQIPEVTFEPIADDTVAKRYDKQYVKLFPPGKPDFKPSADDVVGLAEWALSHGMNDKFVDLMKKLADVDKDHPVVAAFNQLQADLDKPVKDASGDLGAHLGQGYTEATLTGGKGHYVLFYSVNNSDSAEVQDRLARLEDALHTFYYWFALKGPELIQHRTVHVPEERLPALLAMREDEFRRQHAGFSDPPVVSAGFFARRENLAVFCATPQDPTYDMLLKASASIWDTPGWNRYDILTGKEKMGYPRTGATLEERAYAGSLAVLTKALEVESARAGVSHDATRQLLFASGLLPRGVTVPEWVQFGMGSFFETPPHAPWPSPTGKSSLYLPIFRDEMSEKGQKFGGDPYKSMRSVVTDGCFRDLKPEDLKKSSPDLLRARAETWGLMYFLAQRKLGNLQRYFQLLGELPRDLELDDQTLWECYARAFDAFDPKTKRIDEAKLGNLAAAWQDYVMGEQFGTQEDEALMEKLHRAYENLNKVAEGKPAPAGPPQGPQPLGR